MRDVVDPELGINVVDLGLVYRLNVTDDAVAKIDMSPDVGGLPADRRDRGSGAHGARRERTVHRPGDQLGVAAAVGPDKITDDGREQLLRTRLHRLREHVSSTVNAAAPVEASVTDDAAVAQLAHGIARTNLRRSLGWFASLAILLLICLLSLSVGAKSIPLGTVWDALFAFSGSQDLLVVGTCGYPGPHSAWSRVPRSA